jgi:thiamine biosynthesis protein ThiS
VRDSEMIRVNDKFDVEWQEGMNVNSLLKILKFTFPMIVVAVNGKVVPKSAYGTIMIEDNDEVKVIHLVAGG